MKAIHVPDKSKAPNPEALAKMRVEIKGDKFNYYIGERLARDSTIDKLDPKLKHLDVKEKGPDDLLLGMC